MDRLAVTISNRHNGRIPPEEACNAKTGEPSMFSCELPPQARSENRLTLSRRTALAEC